MIEHKKEYKFGIELESLIDYSRMDSFANAIRHLPYSIGSDGSVHSETTGESGMEIRCKGKGLSYTMLERSVKKLCRIAGEHNVTVNKTCGFHLHVSNKRFFTHRNLKRIIMVWVAIEDILIATQPRTRFNNSYCMRYLQTYTRDQVDGLSLSQAKDKLITELGNMNRRHALNLASLAKHGTIEIRLHSGTVNSEKILNWIELMLSLYEYALRDYKHSDVMELFNMPISDEKIAKVFALLKLPEQIKTHFLNRIAKFMFTTLASQQTNAILVISQLKELKKLRKQYQDMNKKYTEVSRKYTQKQDSIRTQVNAIGNQL